MIIRQTSRARTASFPDIGVTTCGQPLGLFVDDLPFEEETFRVTFGAQQHQIVFAGQSHLFDIRRHEQLEVNQILNGLRALSREVFPA
jgi:hypothetical protein